MIEDIRWFYAEACRQFYSIKGLLFSLVIPLFLFLTVAKLITISLSLLLYVIISLLIILMWFIKRSIPKVKKGKIGVLFAPWCNDETKKELIELSMKLNKEVENKDFTKMISVKTLPPNIEVGEHFKNLEVLSKANSAVLICGNFEKFTDKGKNITGFSSFTITARTLPVSPRDVPVILGDAIIGRQLGWTAENTIHKNVVVKNLSEISRYIVGLSLIADKQYEKAQIVLGPLLVEINQKYNQKKLSVEIRRFKETIRLAYVLSLAKKVSTEYNEELIKENLFHLGKEKLVRWNETLTEALRVESKNFETLLILAIVRFLRNDVMGAKDSIRKARQLVPMQSQNLCDLSESFLLCFEGELREARKLYRKLTKNPPSYQTMDGVFSFLSQAIEEYKDKPQIRFVYALLNDEYGDSSIALIEFTKFISETEGNVFYGKWNREAKIRIKRIEQANKDEKTQEE